MTEDQVKGSESEPQFDLGIVVVHGIGDNKQGETLIQFGEPLIECLHRRLEPIWRDFAAAHPQSVASINDPNTGQPYPLADFFYQLDIGTRTTAHVMPATPSPMRRLDPCNASAEIKVSYPHFDRSAQSAKSETLRDQKWHLLETWWGEQVIPPAARDVIGWMLARGPWIIGQFFLERYAAKRALYAAWGGFKIALAMWYFLCGVIATFVAQCALVLFAIASLLPLSNKWVGSLLLSVSGVIGDAYVLIVQDIQHAAIVDRLKTTLERVRPNCRRLVVIAHSQGTGVLVDTLTQQSEGKAWAPDGIITFGAGLRKLKTLYYAENRERLVTQLAGWCLPLSLALGAFVTLLLRVAVGGTGMALAIGALIALAGAWYVVKNYLLASYDRCAQTLQSKMSRHDLTFNVKNPRWMDFYATHDPVPNGGLAKSSSTMPTATVNERKSETLFGYPASSAVIHNEGSWLRDHTSYLDNKLEFCLPIVDYLLEITGIAAPKTSLSVEKQSNFYRAHEQLVAIKGHCDGPVCFLALAALPALSMLFGAAHWPAMDWVRMWTEFAYGQCNSYLPDFLASNACPVVKNVRPQPSPWFSATVLGMSLTLGYVLFTAVLTHIQLWWKTEISHAFIRILNDEKKSLSKTALRVIVWSIGAFYVLPVIAITALMFFPIGPTLRGLLHLIVFGMASAFIALSTLGIAYATAKAESQVERFGKAMAFFNRS